MFRSELDHLVVASADLDQGVDWIERQLGVRPQPGGQHVAMGTHNALLKLGPRAYLEVIAIDPDGAPPARPRWFALDEPAMQIASRGWTVAGHLGPALRVAGQRLCARAGPWRDTFDVPG